MSSKTKPKNKIYKEEVLGKHVSIKFVDTRKWYRGQITQMKQIQVTHARTRMVSFRANNSTVVVNQDRVVEEEYTEYEHYIVFDDGDEKFLDLAYQEKEKCLRWEEEEDEQPQPDPASSQSRGRKCKTEEPDTSAETPNDAAEDTTRTAVPDPPPHSAFSGPEDVPSKEPEEEKKEEDFNDDEEHHASGKEEEELDDQDNMDRKPAATSRKRRATPTATSGDDEEAIPDPAPSSQAPAVVTPTKAKRQKTDNTPLDFSKDEINLEDFENWLRTIHTGQKGNPISIPNGNSVMRQVRLLVSGKGIKYPSTEKYENWPDDVCFYDGIKVTLKENFDQMLQTAKWYEDQYGKDRGHGWLLQHPIMKLKLYKDYCEAHNDAAEVKAAANK